jgi:hypothetical protein
MNKNCKVVKKIIAFVVFCCIAVALFVRCTYLFRRAKDARQVVLGFYQQEENSLNVVFVGGSNVHEFWNTMAAWNDYGIASYDYSVSAMAAGSIISAIEEVKKTQTPELVVVDARKFLDSYMDYDFDMPFRNAFDSQDISLDRFLGVHYVQRVCGLTYSEALSEYLDIIYYHDNYEALGNEKNWEYIDNRADDDVNGSDLYI